MKHFSWSPCSPIVWDTHPARDWAEAYPLGDGRLGAMVFGRPCEEIIALNHDRLWRNYLHRPSFHTHRDMPEIIGLCKEKKWYEANELLKQTLPNQNTIYINPFVPAIDQYITLFQAEEAVSDYRRWLDLEHGIAHTEYTLNGITYHREMFCSAEHRAFITHIRASRPCMLTGALSLSRIGDPECTVTGGAERNAVFCEGEFEEGVRFAALSRIYHRNGRLTGGKAVYGIPDEPVPEKRYGLGYVFNRDQMFDKNRGASIVFDTCDELWIVTAVAVDAENENPLAACRETLDREFSYEAILAAQRERFSSYYNRVRLTVADTDDYRLPTPQLLARDRQSGKLSPALCELAYNMSRYVAIASGMPRLDPGETKAPIHLQGIWNRDTRPAWESDYHTDLNIQMCYWPLPSMGLADLMEPFLCWMERLLPQAQNCAADIYGCRGAAYAGCCDDKTIGAADVVGGGSLGITAWLFQILWIYYEHQPSEVLLSRIYHLMCEADIFYRDMFCREEDGTFSFPFGASPEMGLLIDNKVQWFSSPSTFDLTIVREFYENYRTAARLLSDTRTVDETSEILSHLAQPHMMADGSLCEWSEEHIEAEPGHRHRSPFVGFCPGILYSPQSQPDMTAAMEKLLERRLASGNKMSTAFSYVWDAQILARLYYGDRAYDMLEMLLRIHALDNMLLTTNDWEQKNGGIAWFVGTKLMQIEAQIAYSAALTELFYQDMQGIIRILPALPAALPNGSITGIHGRNGILCDITWENGALSEARLTVQHDGICRLLPPQNHPALTVTQDEVEVLTEWDDGILTFPCTAGTVYSIH